MPSVPQSSGDRTTNAPPPEPITTEWAIQWVAAHSPTQFANLKNRELAHLMVRYNRWRNEIAQDIQGKIADDPGAPVGSDQAIYRYCDGRHDELRVEMDQRLDWRREGSS